MRVVKLVDFHRPLCELNLDDFVFIGAVPDLALTHWQKINPAE